MSGSRRQAVLVTTLLAAACGGPADVAFQPIKLDPFASAPSPLSRRSQLTLLAGGAACVIDSYEQRVNCMDPGGESVDFGTEGEGPGEFRFPTFILRGPLGTIGVVDGQLNRLSMFSASGEFRTSTGELPGPLLFGRHQVMDGAVSGSYRRSDPSGDRSTVQAEIDVETGRVEWERAFPHEADVASCSTPLWRTTRLLLGYGDGSGDLMFVTCHGEFLVWYADRDAEEPAAIVQSPTYVERYPTDEEVASEVRLLRSAAWRPVVNEEELRARPKVWYGARVMDDRRRFWAVSHWNAWADMVAFSQIDMFCLTDRGPEYALTLQVADKVVGMDVLGDTLAVLVVRDAGGVIPERRVDWYDISSVTDLQ
ncbi:MAG: hypothetical protein F4Y74_12505 [Gemmatimonadales bacterium]|uniref:hypothetical protein n=1 Tax=Candidatus Palauibacter scopulicola TaxID=3056741 RepID=UPI00137F0235|nr:hypothetical protein [Candidatus Palauibacter scopulicola]MDE2663474.1 hypothetical protein [Candidatus Palauibacter scopulicola]MXX69763.1 hypothetical protein [Gemmatimonadales bacterium]MYG19353.1 hypothetical protein [Gemmatimonadales bacterium]